MINIKENVILAPYTTFKIGGPAKLFIEAENEEMLKESLGYALKNKLNFFVLGGGSNVLINDRGFNGLVIKFQNAELKIAEEKIECGAGAPLSKLVGLTAENYLSGLEWAAGIPGTVGGAIRGNAGAFGGNINNSIEKIRAVFQEGEKIVGKDFTKEECEFEYRNSLFKKNKNLIVVSAIFKFKKDDKEKIGNKIKEITEKRNFMHPQGIPSAGSFFVNPQVNDQEIIEKFEKDSGAKAQNYIVPAGWLIQEAGLTGKKIGGAQVSEKHSNFIVNTGNATAEDVIMLSSIIKQKVRSKFGVQLMEEVKFLGF